MPSRVKCADMSNYRPISNLHFLSKLVKKIVARRIEYHKRINNLQGRYQSAYRKDHSTETALMKVHSDISDSLDDRSMAALELLDLSAAFAVINQTFGV